MITIKFDYVDPTGKKDSQIHRLDNPLDALCLQGDLKDEGNTNVIMTSLETGRSCPSQIILPGVETQTGKE